MKSGAWRQWLILYGLTVLLGLIFASQRYFWLVMQKQPAVLWQVLFIDVGGRVISASFAPFILLIIRRFRPEKLGWLRVIGIHILACSIFSILSILLFDLIGNTLFTALGATLPSGAKFSLPRIFARVNFYVILLFVCSAIDSYQRYREQILNASQLEARLARAQVDSLKIKLEPEFLLGSLRAISSVMRRDIEEADRMTARLGDFLRSTLESSSNSIQSLKQELDFLECYLEIEQLLHQNKIEVRYNTGPGTLNLQVPSRILQMLVSELTRKQKTVSDSGSIMVQCLRKNHRLEIQVEFALPGCGQDSNDSQSWLHGVEVRLEQLYAEDYKLSLVGSEGSQCRISIDIPMQSESSEPANPYSELLKDTATDGKDVFPLVHPALEVQEAKSPRPLWKRCLWIAAIWTCIGLTYSAVDLINAMQNGQKIIWSELAWSYLGWYFWAALTPFVMWLVQKYPIRSPHAYRNIGLLVATSIGLLFSNIALYGLVYMQTDGTKTFSQAVYSIITSFAFAFDYFIFWIIAAVGHSLAFYKQFQKEKVQAARIENQLATAQLQALQMQLHPHFLFNTLNSISELMHEDVDLADRMLLKLESFLQLTLASSGAHEVPLGTELEFLNHYLEIEQIRFQDRLTVKMNIQPNTMKVRVPNLILQPIVENAIRHGISRRSAPGQLEIDAMLNEGMLQVRVKDNGRGLPAGIRAGEIREGLGISNTRARLRQMYGSQQSLVFSNVLEGGFLVKLIIPAIEGLSNHG